MKLAPCLAAALALAACSACRPPRAPASDEPAAESPKHAGTRLVVLLVLDQWPEWAFEQKRPALHAGFDRMLSEGEWHVGRYPYAATVTAVGHAMLGTGEPPAESGIEGDSWWHRDLQKLLPSTEAPDGTTSPYWLRVPGLGDAVAAAHDGAKAVAVSLKARASLFMLGHAGTAVWYDPMTAQLDSNVSPVPPWVGAYAAAHPIDAKLHEVWTPLDPAQVAKLAGVPDDDKGEVGEEGFGPTFPHDPQATKQPGHALMATPAGNELVIDLAIAAIDGEHLGADDKPDLLAISLSSHDLVGHGWGQESWEMWDEELRLDQQLARLFDALDREVGPGRWAMIATGDHGASPLPEKIGGGRMTAHELQVAANRAAIAVLGDGTWIDDAHAENIYFSAAMLAQPKSELDSATRHVLNALRAFPGIAVADRVASVAGHCDKRTGRMRTLCESFDPERSGDLFYLPAKGWIMQGETMHEATAHGSLNDYDRLVPVVVLAPGRKRHAPDTAPRPGELDMATIAPRLAHWLGVTPPTKLPRPAPPPAVLIGPPAPPAATP